MTVPNATCRIPYVGTNSQFVYAFPFLVFQAADLVVQTQATATSAPVTLTLTTDYLVTGLGSYTGGTITLLAGNLPTGVVLSIFRNPAQVQTLQLQEQTAYNAQAVMGALDYAMMTITALQDQVTRCIQIDPLDPTTPTSGTPGPPYPSCVLPPMASTLGQYIYRDPGTGTFLGAGGPGSSAGPYLVLTLGTVQTVTGAVNFNGTVNFGGTTAATTQAPGNNTILLATTAFVTAAVAALSTTYAPLASPALTGVPTAPTAAAGTNTTQLATTAFVQGALGNNGLTQTVVSATGNYTVPAGVTKVRVRLWGAGSSGQGSSTGIFGGGGGAYLETVLTVVPGDILNFVIGAGGAAIGTLAYNNGGATTVAKNGGAVLFTAGGGTGNAGGTATGSGTTLAIPGQVGGTGIAAGAISGAIAMGAGGNSPQGGAGGPSYINAPIANGFAGAVPGGGGSSAGSTNSGAGANGLAVVEV